MGPENTLAAFDRAMALGVDGLELDVRLSRDGVPVLLHDPLLDRTTNTAGAITARTAAELADVDAGFHFGPDEGYPFRGQGIGVPTLRAVLARYPGTALIVEIKGGEAHLIHATLEDIRSAGAFDRVCIGSFSVKTLNAVRALEPAATTSAARADIHSLVWRSWVGRPLRSLPYDVCQAPYRFKQRRVLSRRMLRLLHAAGVPVQAFTVNEPEDVERLLDWGVDTIITDRPAMAVSAVRAWLAAPPGTPALER